MPNTPCKPLEYYFSKFQEKHGNKYDYSNISFRTAKDPITITCPEHGPWETCAKQHMKFGCRFCSYKTTHLSQTKTLEEFLEAALNLHGDKFDYLQITEWNGYNKNITIGCNACGTVFTTTPKTHLKVKYGCPKCKYEALGQANLTTKEEFIAQANEIHNNFYDYSQVHQFKTTREKVTIICPDHGSFFMSPFTHVNGKCGCRLCANDRIAASKTKPCENFLIDAKRVHGDLYDYSLVEENWGGYSVKVPIICKKHGEFPQKPSSHINTGAGCPKCKIDNLALVNVKPPEKFMEEILEIHGDTYDYSLTKYTTSENKIRIICKIHGEFKQVAGYHLGGHGCPKCSHRISKPAKKWLDLMGVPDTLETREVAIRVKDKVHPYHADGYDPVTNTVYDFLGSYWHGDPTIYNPDHYNEICKKTYGELYQKTIERSNEIRASGYNLVEIWESEWKKMERSGVIS